MSTSLQWEAPAAGIRLFLSKATIQALALQPAVCNLANIAE